MYTPNDVKLIVNYIKKEQKEGHSIPKLRKFLLNNGYEKELVDTAIDSLYSRKMNFDFIVDHKKGIGVGIAAILLLGLIFSGVFVSQNLLIQKEVDLTTYTPSVKDIDLREVPEVVPEKVEKNTIKENKVVQETEEPKDTTKKEAKSEQPINREPNKEINLPSDCEGEDKDQCLLGLAYSENGSEACAQIQNVAKKNLCRSIVKSRERGTENLAFSFDTGEIVHTSAGGDIISLEDFKNLEFELDNEEVEQ
jgi:hypothetical protein